MRNCLQHFCAFLKFIHPQSLQINSKAQKNKNIQVGIMQPIYLPGGEDTSNKLGEWSELGRKSWAVIITRIGHRCMRLRGLKIM